MIYALFAFILLGILIAAFEEQIVIKYRSKISLISLSGACCAGALGGFSINEAAGFFSVCVVLLVIAFLFGYDRG
jgi:hypothetical protein